MYRNGRYAAEAIIIRELPELTIIFLNKETICVFPKKGSGTQFHRWFAEKGTYQNGWKLFRQFLLVEKHLTYLHCFELAARYSIDSVSARSFPDLTGKLVKYKRWNDVPAKTNNIKKGENNASKKS